ncbi:MAG: class I SAM-dependent methyltransferase [Firmicutes bacterium]|nr:class I SAM-dependent methyltransferase [Bacillota bacterium]
MSNYEGLSKIYDFMMSGVDYEAWADYVLSAAKRFGCEPKTVLDLACGTGSTTLPLAARGVKATGLDLAPAMIKIAEEKAEEAGLDVDFVIQNMLELDFPEPFDMIVSFQDGINYLTGEGDFEKLAAAVGSNLKDGGVFLFDLNRVDHYSDSDTTVVDLDDMYLVYENNYNADTRIWHIKLTGFLQEGELYRKFEEVHEEKNHDFEEVKAALSAHGMSIAAVWRMFYEEDATDDIARVLVIAKKG